MLSKFRFLNVVRTIVRPHDVKRMKPNNICFTKDFSSTGFSNQKTNSTQNIGFQRDFKCLKKPFLFTILVAGVSYSAAAIWQYEGLRKRKIKIQNPFGRRTNSQSQRDASLKKWLKTLDPHTKIVASIIAANVAVFMLWKVPALKGIMMTFFTASPTGGAPCTSLLLAAFSHVGFIHLFANMYVLNSFTPAISKMFGPEQFLATYVTAAVVSGFGSYVVKVIRGSRMPSLGASGAIIAFLGMVCHQFGDARLSIAFVDSIYPHSFSAQHAVKGLILFDTVGLLLGWRLFDHAAHLAGMFFGIWYINYGQKMIWSNRNIIVKKWHSFRDKPSKN